MPDHGLHGSTAYADVAGAGKELPPPGEVYRACEHALDRFLATIRGGGDIDGRALACAMRDMVESMQRSPGAILLFNAVHRRESHELARAMDTSIWMVAFGRYLQYADSRLEMLGLAGMLLDVGMTLLPEAIVQAAHADDVVDDALVESHVLHSVELIRSANGLPARVAEVVVAHHERQDGEGYPYGLARDQISADGAIAAIVDSFSRLTSPRPQAGQLSAARALTLLQNQRGGAFHEGLTGQFTRCVHKVRRALPRD